MLDVNYPPLDYKRDDGQEYDGLLPPILLYHVVSHNISSLLGSTSAQPISRLN